MKKKLNFLIGLLIGLSFSLPIYAQEMKKMDKDPFMVSMKEENVQLVDVRTPAEFEEGHISEAILADWRNKKNFRKKIKKLDKNRPVYIYCASGRRSNEAAKWMTRKGFMEVIELEGGVKDRPEILIKD